MHGLGPFCTHICFSSFFFLSFFFFSFLLGTCAKQPVSGPCPRNDLNILWLHIISGQSQYWRLKTITVQRNSLPCECVNDHVNQITLQINKLLFRGSTSTKRFINSLIPGRNAIWKCWFDFLGEGNTRVPGEEGSHLCTIPCSQSMQ